MMQNYKNTNSNLKGIAIAVLFSFIVAFGVNSQVRVMVDDDGVAFTSVANHSTWADATNDLQAAIDSVAVMPGGGEVWVAGGTYLPTSLRAADPTATEVTDPRQASFVMASNVRVLGGFEGNESSEEARPGELFGVNNRVILSGDIGAANDTTDNAYHVVLFPFGVDNTAILEGVFVTLGNANSNTYFAHRGGGIHVREAGIIRECVITDNYSSEAGGGVYLYSGGNLINSEVSFNKTQENGGGVFFNLGGMAQQCLIHSNRAINPEKAYGGGVFLGGETGFEGTISHSLVFGNISADKAGGIGLYGAGNITNNLISNNNATGNGGGIYFHNGGKIINNTIVSNFAEGAAGVYANEGGEMYNTVIWGNATPYESNTQFAYLEDDATLQVMVNYCAIQGNNDPILTNSINLDPANTGTDLHPYFRNPITFAGIPADQAEVDEIYASDYRINLESALLDAGLTNPNGIPLPLLDLGGNQRELQASVDIGAFEADYFIVSGAISEGNGTITPLDTIILRGGEILFTLTPETGYDLETFTLNETDYTSSLMEAGSSFTYTATVTEDINAVVSFGIPSNLEEADADKFSLYPVPAENELFISGASIRKVQIFSTDGKLVKLMEGSKISSVPVSGLTNGLYFISLTDDTGKIIHSRFIKK